jgi:hypothetical protein
MKPLTEHDMDHKRIDNDGVHPLLNIVFACIVDFFDQFLVQI